MLGGILDTIRSFFKSVKKEKVYDYVDYLFNHINSSLLPSIETIIKSKNLPDVKNNKFFPMIYKGLNFRTNDNYKALEELRAIFVDISKQEGNIRKLVDDSLPDVITNKAMRVKDAAIISLIRDLTSITSYTLDLLYYIIVDETVSELPRIKFKRIQEGAATYVTLLNTYKNIKKYVKSFDNISTEVIELKSDVEKDIALIEQVVGNTGGVVPIPTQNFVYNPIYHFRMWLIDKEVQRYEALKVKKEMIELKIHELQLEQQGDVDRDLSNQIHYYENKLAGIEYKIEKIENN